MMSQGQRLRLVADDGPMLLPPPLTSFMSHLPFTGPLGTSAAFASWTAPVGDQMGASQAAWQRFNALIKSADEKGADGGYVGWLTRMANGAICRQGSQQPLMGLLMFFDCGGSVRDYEQYIGAIVDPKADAAKTAANLRNRRLELILQKGGPLQVWKVVEMEDTSARILPSNEMFPHRNFFSWSKGSQFDAYVNDGPLYRLLKEMERNAPILCGRQEKRQRTDRRRTLLKEFLSHSSDGAWTTNSGIVQTFRILGDRFSLKIAKAIEKNEFELRLRSPVDFDLEVGAIAKRLRAKNPHDATTLDAYYVRGGCLEKKGVLFVRTLPLGMDIRASDEDVLFEVLALIVHEYQHHLDMRPGESPPLEDIFPVELKGHTREFLWRANYGDAKYLEEYARESATGFALRFRDRFERWA